MPHELIRSIKLSLPFPPAVLVLFPALNITTVTTTATITISSRLLPFSTVHVHGLRTLLDSNRQRSFLSFFFFDVVFVFVPGRGRRAAEYILQRTHGRSQNVFPESTRPIRIHCSFNIRPLALSFSPLVASAPRSRRAASSLVDRRGARDRNRGSGGRGKVFFSWRRLRPPQRFHAFLQLSNLRSQRFFVRGQIQIFAHFGNLLVKIIIIRIAAFSRRRRRRRRRRDDAHPHRSSFMFSSSFSRRRKKKRAARRCRRRRPQRTRTRRESEDKKAVKVVVSSSSSSSSAYERWCLTRRRPRRRPRQ